MPVCVLITKVRLSLKIILFQFQEILKGIIAMEVLFSITCYMKQQMGLLRQKKMHKYLSHEDIGIKTQDLWVWRKIKGVARGGPNFCATLKRKPELRPLGGYRLSDIP